MNRRPAKPRALLASCRHRFVKFEDGPFGHKWYVCSNCGGQKLGKKPYKLLPVPS